MSEPGERTIAPVRILTVCTHNRTRSVMMEALLRSMLSARLGPDGVVVTSGGFGPAGMPAISEAVEAMARRGLDVSSHRSRQVDGSVLRHSDLILTAERDHVVKIASIDPAAFRRALTLPEFVSTTSRATGSAGTLADWVTSITSERTAMAYLRDPIEEVDDPTGTTGRTFEHAVVAIEAACSMAATAIVNASRSGLA